MKIVKVYFLRYIILTYPQEEGGGAILITMRLRWGPGF